MKTNETESSSTQTSTSRHAPSFAKVLDARKHAIRGLWRRGSRYYAQITIEDPGNGIKRVKRVPLEGAATDSQAVAKYQELLTQRRKGVLPALKRTPTFTDYAQKYFDYYQQVKDAKRASTLYTERIAVNHWIEHLGHLRLDKINRAIVNGYLAKRQASGVTGRTVNLEVICFRNVMKRAIDDGWITSLPTVNLRPLKWTPRKRTLVDSSAIERLCNVAIKGRDDGEQFKNGRQFADFVLLMAYCGSRRGETLRLKWTDVDWENKQLTIGSDDMAKNHKSRAVDFNAKLKAHLTDMRTRQAPDSQWMFPSPQRGEKDRSAKTFVETMRLVRSKAGFPNFGFHDCRHHFTSFAVMSGIDFMTVARWLGHQDGGVLIGKVYGHLSDAHAKAQAQRLNFGPVALAAVAE